MKRKQDNSEVTSIHTSIIPYYKSWTVPSPTRLVSIKAFAQKQKKRRLSCRRSSRSMQRWCSHLLPATEDANKLVLYGFYKQSTAGDVNSGRPGFFSPTERATWDAWKAFEKMSKDEAMREYINKVKQLQEQTSTK